MSVKISLVFLLASCLILWTHGYVQELSLYETTGQNASYFVFKRHVPDFSNHIFSNLTSFCLRGFWMMYMDIDYEGSTTLLGSQSNKDTVECYNETFQYRSFRYGAGLDTTQEALSVYPQEGYEGHEVLITGPAKSQLVGRSLLVSGMSDWLIFEDQNFEGKFICLKHSAVLIDGHENVTTSLNLSQIGSVVRGCDTRQLKALKKLLAKYQVI